MKKQTRQFRTSRWWSNVQALRCDLEISEKDLSTLVGRTDSYISLAVKNSGIPNVADALAIADVLGASVEDLAFGSIGLEIRKAQLEAELKRITEEIEDARRDVTGEAEEGKQNDQS